MCFIRTASTQLLPLTVLDVGFSRWLVTDANTSGGIILGEGKEDNKSTDQVEDPGDPQQPLSTDRNEVYIKTIKCNQSQAGWPG